MSARGQVKTTVVQGDATGVIGPTASPASGAAIKSGPGRLHGIVFCGGASTYTSVNIFDGLTVSGTLLATFYCGGAAAFQTLTITDLDLTFLTGLSVSGTGVNTTAGLKNVTLIYE